MAKGKEEGRKNKADILRYFIDHGETTRSAIAKALDLSTPTVLKYTNELQEEGLLEEAGIGESTGGRKAGLFRINGSYCFSVGIDVTANHICFALVNMSKEKVAVHRYRSRYAHQISYFQEMAKELARFLEGENVSPAQLLGIGFSFPGILEKSSGLLTYSHALGLRNMSLTVLQKYFPCRLYFENDAVNAARAELSRFRRDAVYLFLGNTVGGAIYLKGQFYEGNNYKSAEFGHMSLHPGGKKCYCGKKGCADAYCNAGILTEGLADTLEDFFSKLEQGNEKARERWKTYLEELALEITNLRMVFDCDIVLGGYVGGFLEPYILQLEAAAARTNTFEKDAGYIYACRYRYEAAAMGGAVSFIDRFVESGLSKAEWSCEESSFD